MQNKTKYGLQLRIQPQNRQPVAPPVPRAPGFGDNDDDDHDVNRDIARQATKKKLQKDIEEQQKKALEEDPTVYDYDGVSEQMKAAQVRPLAQDRQERKSKYIQRLMEKAKEREREHEIIYERKLAKERGKDEHLFADKDKFITSAYKKKLAEQEKWKEEDRLRQLREERDDVTKKSDISDFYFNLSNNVAFGAKAPEPSRQVKQEAKANADTLGKQLLPNITSPSKSGEAIVDDQAKTSFSHKNNSDPSVVKTEADTPMQEKSVTEHPSDNQKAQDHHKRNEDAVAAAKERFLARKKSKVN